MSTKRAALIGTAQTWNQCPWDDPDLYIVSLNDAYTLGVPRANAWYDTHPVDKMWFRPKNKSTFRPGEIPEGVYVRPEGHVEWLKEKAKTIPVWLHNTPPEDWPVNAQRLPWDAVKTFLKARPDQECYAGSSPAYILAHLILQGFTEIQIYGIHLATQGEYIKQRPGFEWLLGRAEAMGIQIVLPPECPLLKHSHLYALEPEPVRPDAAALKRLDEARQQHATLASALVTWPRWKSKTKALAELRRLEAVMADAKHAGRHAQLQAGAA